LDEVLQFRRLGGTANNSMSFGGESTIPGDAAGDASFLTCLTEERDKHDES